LGRSNSSSALRAIVRLDRLALAGLAFGLGLYVLPFWREGRLRWGFWLTLAFTLLHVYTSHARGDRAAPLGEGT
jgi:hypothetical protein